MLCQIHRPLVTCDPNDQIMEKSGDGLIVISLVPHLHFTYRNANEVESSRIIEEYPAPVPVLVVIVL